MKSWRTPQRRNADINGKVDAAQREQGRTSHTSPGRIVTYMGTALRLTSIHIHSTPRGTRTRMDKKRQTKNYLDKPNPVQISYPKRRSESLVNSTPPVVATDN